MRPLSLTQSQQQRLEKLAAEAGRTPSQMWRIVLRDGFDFCEWEVRESARSDAAVAYFGAVPHREVQRQAQALLDAAHARKSRKAA